MALFRKNKDIILDSCTLAGFEDSRIDLRCIGDNESVVHYLGGLDLNTEYPSTSYQRHKEDLMSELAIDYFEKIFKMVSGYDGLQNNYVPKSIEDKLHFINECGRYKSPLILVCTNGVYGYIEAILNIFLNYHEDTLEVHEIFFTGSVRNSDELLTKYLLVSAEEAIKRNLNKVRVDLDFINTEVNSNFLEYNGFKHSRGGEFVLILDEGDKGGGLFLRINDLVYGRVSQFIRSNLLSKVSAVVALFFLTANIISIADHFLIIKGFLVYALDLYINNFSMPIAEFVSPIWCQFFSRPFTYVDFSVYFVLLLNVKAMAAVKSFKVYSSLGREGDVKFVFDSESKVFNDLLSVVMSLVYFIGWYVIFLCDEETGCDNSDIMLACFLGVIYQVINQFVDYLEITFDKRSRYYSKEKIRFNRNALFSEWNDTGIYNYLGVYSIKDVKSIFLKGDFRAINYELYKKSPFWVTVVVPVIFALAISMVSLIFEKLM